MTGPHARHTTKERFRTGPRMHVRTLEILVDITSFLFFSCCCCCCLSFFHLVILNAMSKRFFGVRILGECGRFGGSGHGTGRRGRGTGGRRRRCGTHVPPHLPSPLSPETGHQLLAGHAGGNTRAQLRRGCCCHRNRDGVDGATHTHVASHGCCKAAGTESHYRGGRMGRQ